MQFCQPHSYKDTGKKIEKNNNYTLYSIR